MGKKISNKDSGLLASILYIVLGALLLIFRADAIGLAMTIAGIFFVIIGVLELVRRNFFGGAVSLLIGILIIVLGWKIAEIVFLVLGILLAIKGIIALFDALKAKKGKILRVLFALLTVICGLVFVFAFGELVDILVIVGGIMILVDGIVGLIAALKK